MLTDSKKLISKAKLKFKFRDYEESKKLLEQALDHVTDKDEIDTILKLSDEIQKNFESYETKINEQIEREDEI